MVEPARNSDLQAFQLIVLARHHLPSLSALPSRAYEPAGSGSQVANKMLFPKLPIIQPLQTEHFVATPECLETASS